jgi:hypothetical protein
MGLVTPGEVEAVTSWLRSEGFSSVGRVVSPDHFGDEQSTWSRGQALVRLTRDRGQWWCDLSLVGWTEWFDVDVVAASFETKDQAVERRVLLVDELSDRLLDPLQAASRGESRF